jgi:hypothetical protein
MLLISRLVAALALAGTAIASLQIVSSWSVEVGNLANMIRFPELHGLLVVLTSMSKRMVEVSVLTIPDTYYHNTVARNHRNRLNLLLDRRKQAQRERVSVYQLLLQQGTFIPYKSTGQG